MPRSREQESKRYGRAQYDYSPCNGLGTAGFVCPSILLPCMVLSESRARPTMTTDCSIMPLTGLGSNPSIIPLDESMLPSLVNVTKTPKYLASDRYQSFNKLVKCGNRHAHTRKIKDDPLDPMGETRVSLLDRHFRVVGRTIVRSEGCVKGFSRMSDGRLMRVENSSMIYMAYANYWSSHCEQRKGYFLSPLRLSVPLRPARSRRSAEMTDSPGVKSPGGKLPSPFDATILHTSNDTRSRRPDSGMVELTAPRNGGVFIRRDGTAAELVDIAPKTTFWKVPLSPVELRAGLLGDATRARPSILSHRLAPRSFSAEVHNSIHPIWVAELDAHLAIGHVHYLPRKDMKGGFEFGSSYRQIFFTIDDATLAVKRHSRELCMPSLESSGSANRFIEKEADAFCDGVQFVMSAFRPQDRPDSISVSYGVNDCESALLTFSVQRLVALLEFSNDRTGRFDF